MSITTYFLRRNKKNISTFWLKKKHLILSHGMGRGVAAGRMWGEFKPDLIVRDFTLYSDAAPNYNYNYAWRSIFSSVITCSYLNYGGIWYVIGHD